MRYIKSIAAVLLLLSQGLSGTAQNIVNGDFSQNNGNDDAYYNCGTNNSNGTFLDNSVENWVRTHGTPRFRRPCDAAPDADVLPNQMYMGSYNAEGEGIAGGYSFKAGVEYLIALSICYPEDYNSVDVKVVVKATTLLPRNFDANPTHCFMTIPTNTGAMQTIGELNQFTIPGLTNYTMISFIPNADYEYIWIYPHTTRNTHTLELHLKSVSILPKCNEDITFINMPSYNNYVQYRHIYFGTAPSFMSDPHASNTFIANNSIEINPTFETEIYFGKGYDLFEVKPRSCTDDDAPFFEGPQGKPRNTGNSMPGNIGKTRASLIEQYPEAKDGLEPANKISTLAENVRIYPNPTNGDFTIEFPSRDAYTIRISNIVGEVVYEKVISGQSTHNITLKDQLQKGNYIIDISCGGIKKMEKLVIY